MPARNYRALRKPGSPVARSIQWEPEIFQSFAQPLATPDTLAGTGLCVDAACATFTADVRSYTPRWALWSDQSPSTAILCSW